MRKCELDTCCSRCERAPRCPAGVRRDKRARRPMSGSASMVLLRRTAESMGTGWVTVRVLSERLFGVDPDDRVSRMSRMVRTRRPLHKLGRMGLLVTRASAGPYREKEYMVLPEWKEVLC